MNSRQFLKYLCAAVALLVLNVMLPAPTRAAQACSTVACNSGCYNSGACGARGCSTCVCTQSGGDESAGDLVGVCRHQI